jgi:hypothetical protein
VGGAALRELEAPTGAYLADVLQRAGETPEQLIEQGYHVRVGGQRGVELKKALDHPVRSDVEVIVVPKIRGG